MNTRELLRQENATVVTDQKPPNGDEGQMEHERFATRVASTTPNLRGKIPSSNRKLPTSLIRFAQNPWTKFPHDRFEIVSILAFFFHFPEAMTNQFELYITLFCLSTRPPIRVALFAGVSETKGVHPQHWGSFCGRLLGRCLCVWDEKDRVF